VARLVGWPNAALVRSSLWPARFAALYTFEALSNQREPQAPSRHKRPAHAEIERVKIVAK
jgi:hypothetical protein